MRLIADIEANGFLEEVTEIHCIVTKDRDTGKVYTFYGNESVPGDHGSISCGVDYLMAAEELVFHNGVGYDLPVIEKLTGNRYEGQLLDTLVLSRTLNPDRPHPVGCPYVTPNPVTGKNDRIGPHGLAGWGYRVGRGKPSHYAWDVFSPEMLHRCVEDVEITELVLKSLLSEIGAEHSVAYKDLPGYARMEQKVAVLMQDQMAAGWLMDRELLVSHITSLENQGLSLRGEIEPRLPYLAIPEETNIGDVKLAAKFWSDNLGTDEVANIPRRKFVAKYVTKAGKYTASVNNTWGAEELKSVQIGGMFCRVSFRQVKITSNAEVKNFLLTQGWVPDEYNTSKKTRKVTGPKLTQDSLKSVTGEVGMQIGQHMKVMQRLSTMKGWLLALPEDDRLRGQVNPQACPTIRMTHKVLVNVPSVEKKSFFAQEMRECFVAKPGYTLVSADADSCQMRMLCEYMGDDAFTDAVLSGNKEDGTDPHSYNMRKAGLPTRGHAKNFFYGFIFGAGPAKVGKLIGGGPAAGKEIMDRYLKGMPKLLSLQEGLVKALQTKGYLKALDGRKIYVANKKDVLCYLVQGAEAVLMKVAICLSADRIKEAGLDSQMVCVMHDEYTFEVAEKDADQVASIISSALKDAGDILKLSVPSGGTASIGSNWAVIH